MKPVLRQLQAALGRIAFLSPLRRVIGSFFMMPWEHPTVFGLHLAQDYPRFKRGYDHEKEAAEDIQRVLHCTMTKYDRCVVLHEVIRYVEESGLDGDFFECGVWRGGSSGLMALANLRYGKHRRRIQLFDAWGDWPDPTAEDGNLHRELQQGVLLKADNEGAFESCRNLLEKEIGYPPERIIYHRGLFEKTFNPVRHETGQIAVLRLDADWYAGTKLCLETFYDRVVPHGVILLDDYGYSEGCRRAADEFLSARGIRTMLHFADYSCRYFIKPERA